ncbi:alpha-glucuronidase family glycosyl hydrolase [Niveispirillum irakense]|uniref:alpha-glucuronidase family glycosyl hydrolase n=1 Tax=Niveispirillum irakense TaxID=34011 RepID=UPI0003F9133A|nr:alpha-glucuronidase family glycosyl hydrolase [Niveispirillum irakense]
MRHLRNLLVGLLLATGLVTHSHAEDGYDLWLRSRPLAGTALSHLETRLATIETADPQGLAVAELSRGLTGLLGRSPALEKGGAVLLGLADDPAIRALKLDLTGLGPDGYIIRTFGPRTIVAAEGRNGLLYGAFHLLRLARTGSLPATLDVREVPKIDRRILNHWDDLDRHVERGYSGQSIWDWHKLPDWKDPRYTDYARANASIGINGTVLNNVNANATILTAPYLEKVAALADVFRPYGIKVYLTARFSAPKEIGGLPTADPLDKDVIRWWQAKVDEIYTRIPDFGGFLIKANSEGQPGPQDYGRTHADGANMLADAMAPHGGIVMWRAFVYSHEVPDDRAKQAYDEFVPLDGKFRDNVLVQVKNGAIDFQPREPFHPLFGAMPKTKLMMEFQITKEYLGFATHLAYLAPMWKEVLDADTYRPKQGSTVAKVVDGSLDGHKLSAMAGVANIGTDRNWAGSQFDQANWYAYGRLAWNHDLTSEAIAREWIAATFSPDPAILDPILSMMMPSHQAVVDYMTPLGLHHLMGRGHHYGPGPWVEGGPRSDWTSVYYHRATKDGIGFDRTATGSDAISQYAKPLADRFNKVETTPEEFLLWFHHVRWDRKMPSGRTLWAELLHHYGRGIATVDGMITRWDGLKGRIDDARHAEVAAFLAIQRKEAQWWRDASVAYWQSINGLPLPKGEAPPPHDAAYYKALSFPFAPGDGK